MTLPINQIICGDCLEVMKAWPDGCADLVFADPPFNIGKKYTKGDKRADYKEWCGLWIRECWRLLKDTGSFYLMTIPRHLDWKLPLLARKGIFINLIKWRNVSASHNKRSFWGEYQPIALYGKTDKYIFNTYAQRRTIQQKILDGEDIHLPHKASCLIIGMTYLLFMLALLHMLRQF